MQHRLFINAAIRQIPKIIENLGGRLYESIAEVVIPEWQEELSILTKQDCVDYIHNLTINRTYDGYLREKSIVFDHLAHLFPNVRFEESDAEMDHAGDIDFLGHVGNRAFGLQTKPVTSKANFGNYSPSDRMRASFADFTDRFGGKVFIVYSLDGEVANDEVVERIRQEVERLSA